MRKIISKEMQELIDLWLRRPKKLLPNTVKAYTSYLRRLYLTSGIDIPERIKDILSLKDFGEQVKKYNQLLLDVKMWLKNNRSSKEEDDWFSAFKHFCRTILGMYIADSWLSSSNICNRDLCKVVASGVLIPHKSAVERVKRDLSDPKMAKETELTSKDTGHTIHIHGSRVNITITINENDCECESENLGTATAIKLAVIKSLPECIQVGIDAFHGYKVCHIWEKELAGSKYDSVENWALVQDDLKPLLESEVVKSMLRYHVWKLFGFKPDAASEPSTIEGYDELEWGLSSEPIEA